MNQAMNQSMNDKGVFKSTPATQGLLKISRKSTLSSGEIVLTNCSEIKRKQTITLLKHGNTPVMIAPSRLQE